MDDAVKTKKNPRQGRWDLLLKRKETAQHEQSEYAYGTAGYLRMDKHMDAIDGHMQRLQMRNELDELLAVRANASLQRDPNVDYDDEARMQKTTAEILSRVQSHQHENEVAHDVVDQAQTNESTEISHVRRLSALGPSSTTSTKGAVDVGAHPESHAIETLLETDGGAKLSAQSREEVRRQAGINLSGQNR